VAESAIFAYIALPTVGRLDRIRMDPAKRDQNLKRTLWKLAYARRAVQLVLTTCACYELYKVDDEHPMHTPLVCSICVTYARSFTDNDGVGMISAKFARHADPRLQQTHDLLVAGRNSFYAHQDATLTAESPSGERKPLQQVVINISRVPEPQGYYGLSLGLALPEMRLRGIVIPDIRDLCQDLDRRLLAEVQSTMDQLFSDKVGDLARLLEERHTDQIDIPLDIELTTPK
jgi:hypothetical protein